MGSFIRFTEYSCVILAVVKKLVGIAGIERLTVPEKHSNHVRRIFKNGSVACLMLSAVAFMVTTNVLQWSAYITSSAAGARTYR